MKVKVDWDLSSYDDGDYPTVLSMEEAGVKEIVDVPDNIDEEEISDYLSDTYGWCVNKWSEL